MHTGLCCTTQAIMPRVSVYNCFGFSWCLQAKSIMAMACLPQTLRKLGKQTTQSICKNISVENQAEELWKRLYRLSHSPLTRDRNRGSTWISMNSMTNLTRAQKAWGTIKNGYVRHRLRHGHAERKPGHRHCLGHMRSITLWEDPGWLPIAQSTCFTATILCNSTYPFPPNAHLTRMLRLGTIAAVSLLLIKYVYKNHLVTQFVTIMLGAQQWSCHSLSPLTNP